MKRLYQKKLNNPFWRMTIGLIQLCLFFVFCAIIVKYDYKEIACNFFGYPVYDENGDLTSIATLSFFLVVLAFVYFAIKAFVGINRMITWTSPSSSTADLSYAWAEIKSGNVFYSSPSKQGKYKNIESTIGYIAGSNRSKSMSESTDRILAISGGLNVASDSELSFIDGRLRSMSISQGADYLMSRPTK